MAAIRPEVIFVLIFIAFSVLEGVGRRRKTQQKGAPGKPPRPQPRQAGLPGQARVPPQPLPPGSGPLEAGTDTSAGTRAPMPRRPAGAARGEQGKGSEGLIPKGIWEEILGLARGDPPKPRPAEPGSDTSPHVPSREGETLEEIPPFEARSLEPLDVEADRSSSRVQARSGRAEPASSKGSTPPMPPPLLEIGAGAASGRSRRKGQGGRWLKGDLLGDGSAEDLRKAIIITEVLGPPLAMRE